MQTYLEDLIGLLRIKSVYDPATVSPTQPYGQGVAEALDYMRTLALEDGFEVTDYDGHALAVTYGAGPERIDIVSHLDVVAADRAEGWSSDPFDPVLKDGRLIARGTQDMKAAALITYHALREIRQQGIPLKRSLRLVFGTDEERTMKDIEYYILKAGQPTFALTPDGYFPLSIGEKGALMWTLEGEVGLEGLELEGGLQCNVVAPACTFTLPEHYGPSLKEAIRRLNLPAHAEVTGTSVRVDVKGKAAHASTPLAGRNALSDALTLIAEIDDNPMIQNLAKAFSDPFGKGCGLDHDISPMGQLTLNLGRMSVHQGRLSADIDCRYPYGVTSGQLSNRLAQALPGIAIRLPYDAKPTLNDAKSPFIRKILELYRGWSGDMSQPVISGGVSYCKVIDRCVAFGPLSAKIELLAHQKNEAIELDYLNQLYPLYRDTMLALANLEESA